LRFRDGLAPVEASPIVEVSPAPLPHAPPPGFRALFEREMSYVLRSLRRLGVPQADVEDMGHEVFLAVHHQLATYDPARPIRPWLFAFVFRIASHYRRKARHETELQPAHEPHDDRDLADVALEKEAKRQLVLEALDGIELHRRAVFILHELDGVAFPEIAASLGIPIGTAYSRLRLAREDFAKTARRLVAQRGLG
jgi:RNA polymerase sigma-70 factor (ECF subfamily)